MNSKLREEIKGILQNHGCIECREWEDGGRNDEKAEQNLLALFERQLVEERIDEVKSCIDLADGLVLGLSGDVPYGQLTEYLEVRLNNLKANKSREES